MTQTGTYFHTSMRRGLNQYLNSYDLEILPLFQRSKWFYLSNISFLVLTSIVG